MKIKIGNVWYSPNDQLICIQLTSQDKKIISEMSEEADRYCCGPEGVTNEEIEDFMYEVIDELNIDDNPRFGAVHKHLRLRYKVNLRDFSRKFEVDSSHISDLERGVKEPEIDDYIRIVDFIDEQSLRTHLANEIKFRFINSMNKTNVIPQKELKPAFPPRMVKKDES